MKNNNHHFMQWSRTGYHIVVHFDFLHNLNLSIVVNYVVTYFNTN